MQQESLTALVSQHLVEASKVSSGRSAHAVYGGHEHALRQTLIALRAGDETLNGSPGDLITIPDARHSLEVVDDSAVLLTVAIRD